MRVRHLTAAGAAMLALGACDFIQTSGGGSGGGAGQQQQQAAAAPVDPAQLRAAVRDERVRRFYEARQWQPAWNEANAGALLAALGEAHMHALNRSHFLPEGAERAEPAAREAALSLAAVNYADALARGRTNPEQMFEVFTHQRPRTDPAGGLARAVGEGQVREWLASLAPQDPEYRALSEAFAGYRNRAAREGSQAIPLGEGIEPGGNDPRMPMIAEALRENGYLPRQPQPQQAQGQPQAQGGAAAKQRQAAPSTGYTPELVQAVRRLQQDYGINPDGIIGETTVGALNTGALERARALAVNLERRRWMPRESAPTRIDVNTAAAELYYFRDGQLANRRRVVVGQPGNETPELASPMFRLVANPTWTVPRSIEEEEIAPRGAAYLRANNMVRRADGFIVQEPGPRNSLGLVKFDMQNEHAIYLHDTPAKALFNQNQRHFSHGCVRVHDALGFAQMIAEHEGVLEEYRRAHATGEETMVRLPRQIPVRLLYHSVYVDNGRVVFRTDPYGWDERVAQALGLPPRRDRQQVNQHVEDVGP